MRIYIIANDGITLCHEIQATMQHKPWQAYPAFVALAGDEGLTGLALRMQGIEFLLEPLLLEGVSGDPLWIRPTHTDFVLEDRGTDGSQTLRWRKPDLNIFWLGLQIVFSK